MPEGVHNPPSEIGNPPSPTRGPASGIRVIHSCTVTGPLRLRPALGVRRPLFRGFRVKFHRLGAS